MWEPRRLTTLWDFTACYRDSFTLKKNFMVIRVEHVPYFILTSLTAWESSGVLSSRLFWYNTESFLIGSETYECICNHSPYCGTMDHCTRSYKLKINASRGIRISIWDNLRWARDRAHTNQTKRSYYIFNSTGIKCSVFQTLYLTNKHWNLLIIQRKWSVHGKSVSRQIQFCPSVIKLGHSVTT
jgi:hypothetical protein